MTAAEEALGKTKSEPIQKTQYETAVQKRKAYLQSGSQSITYDD